MLLNLGQNVTPGMLPCRHGLDSALTLPSPTLSLRRNDALLGMDVGGLRLGLHALNGKAREPRGLSVRAAEHTVDMPDRRVRVRYTDIGIL